MLRALSLPVEPRKGRRAYVFGLRRHVAAFKARGHVRALKMNLIADLA
jgi:hypothetical protein